MLFLSAPEFHPLMNVFLNVRFINSIHTHTETRAQYVGGETRSLTLGGPRRRFGGEDHRLLMHILWCNAITTVTQIYHRDEQIDRVS